MAENDNTGMGERQDDSVSINSLSSAGSASSTGQAATGLGSTLGSKFVGVGAAFASTIANGGKGIGRAMTKAGSAVGTKLMTAGTGVSGLTGGLISPVAGAAASGGGVVMSTAMVGSLLTGIATDAAQRDGEILKCFENGMENSASGSNSGSGGVDGAEASAQQLETAKQVYSILSYAGMKDENIAGVLGNFEAESGIDPTSAQSTPGEPYTVGPLTKAAAANPSTGIGLGQWTADRNTALQNYAKSVNDDWYTVEVQMSFMIGHDGGNSDVIQKMIKGENKGSNDPVEAALFFHREWERSDDNPEQEARRGAMASKWYAKMSGWDVDEDLGKSVLAMAGTTKKSANNKSAQQELNDCLEKAGGSSGGGNEDAAEAMATYSWAYLDWGNGNNGTELYQYLMGEIFPGDPNFMSCDRGVATAVRWSGTDDTFPVGPTSAQYQYFMGEGGEKWEQLDGIDQESNMKAGDVLVTKGDGHIQMYLGEEVVEKVWGSTPHEPNATMASASFDERSPGLQNWEGYSTDNRPYSGWRSKGPEKDSKYKDIKVPPSTKDGPQSTK